MAKKIFLILFIALIFCPILNVVALNIDISAKYAIVYNVNEDEIIYEKDADEIINIASLTKIMTGIVAIENIDDLEEKVIIPKSIIDNLYYNASIAGFKSNTKVSYRDLLYGLLLPSGADAAETLAFYISGSSKDFVELMNKKAEDLGLKNTHFVNVTGLDVKDHYSTVKDVAVFLKYALKNETFKEIYTTRTYTTTNGLKLESTILLSTKNSNIDLSNILGSKSGYTEKAGLCLSSISAKDDVNLLAVIAGAPFTYSNRALAIKDTNTIYNYFYDNYSYQNIINKGDELVTIKTKYTTKANIIFTSDETIMKYMPNSIEKEDLSYKYEGQKEISYDTPKGKKLGVYTISKDKNTLYSKDIVLEDIMIFSLLKFLKANPKILILSVLIIITFLILVSLIIRRLRKKRRRRRR